ncbi:MAG TPA: hypothetical protein VGH90_04340, partial [Chthoniobacteraceae bacterium]
SNVVPRVPPSVLATLSRGNKNEALAKAWEDYGHAQTEQGKVRSRTQEMREKAANYAVEVWHGAHRADDLTPAVEALKGIRDLDAQHPPIQYGPMFASRPSYEPMLRLLDQSGAFLNALTSGDNSTLLEQRNALQQTTRFPLNPGAQSMDVQGWIDHFREDFEDQLRQFKQETCRQIAAGAEPDVFLGLAAKMESVAAKTRVLRGGAPPFELGRFPQADPYADNKPPKPNLARAWATLQTDLADGDWSAVQKSALAVRNANGGISETDWTPVEKRLAAIDQQRISAQTASRNAAETAIAERISKLTEPASAKAIAEEVATKHQEANDPEAIAYSDLAKELRRIAAIWNGESNVRNFTPSPSNKAPSPAWNNALSALSGRAEREGLAKRANAPELLQPPLANLATAEAVRAFGKTLFSGGDWKRLCVLASEPMSSNPSGSVFSRDDLIGLKSFVTAQNFERAEEFDRAAESYREVLACVGDFVPTDAAIERLKALKREHPEPKQ